MHSFLEYSENSTTFTSALDSICSNSGDRINELASVLHGQLHVLVGAVVGIAYVLQCSSMNPIYTTAVHEAACVNGVSGLAWLFWTQITLAVTCMVMITLRAAWYGAPKDTEQGEESGKESGSKADDVDQSPSDLDLVEDGESSGEQFHAEEVH